MHLSNLDDIISGKVVPKILLIFGEEDFLIDQDLDKLIKALVPTEQERYDFDSLDGEDTNAQTLLDIASSYPFVSPRRVVLCKRFEKLLTPGRASKKAEQSSPFTKYVKNPSPSTILILRASLDNLNGLSTDLANSRNADKAEKKMSSAKYPLSALLQDHFWIEYPKVYDKSYPGWVSKKFADYGKKIAREAADLLIAQCKPSLRELSNEVDKVALYYKDKKEIGIDEINHLVGHTREYNIFELQKAIGEKDISKAYTILSYMLATDKQEMLIITMVSRYFSVLWKLFDESKKTTNPAALAGACGLSPYFVPEYLSAVKRFSPEELDNAFVALCEADFKLKSSATDNLYIMQEMLIKMIGDK